MVGDTLRLTHAIPDALVPWSKLVERERVTGTIPLPAVDTITFDNGAPPVIALLAPEIIPGALHVFVGLTEMSEADQVVVDTHLDLLNRAAERVGLAGDLRLIAHAGGLDFDLVGNETIRLQDVKTAEQAAIWGILQTIASIGATYPDRRAIVEPHSS